MLRDIALQPPGIAVHRLGLPFLISHQIIDPSAQIPAINISAAITVASADRARIPPNNGRRPIFVRCGICEPTLLVIANIRTCGDFRAHWYGEISPSHRGFLSAIQASIDRPLAQSINVLNLLEKSLNCHKR
jgi:hypothetical protein